MENKGFEEINAIPLVDIMLVLLTIVLTTATFIASGEIAVNLPDAKYRDAPSSGPLVITLTEDDRLFLNGEEINANELRDTLNNYGKNKPVIIRPDENIQLKRFAFVVDALKGEGFTRISMEVQDR